MSSDEIDWNDSRVRNHLMRLARIAETLVSAVIITDPQGLTVWVNAGFSRITGYAAEEVLGRSPGQVLQGPKTDRAEVARVGAAIRARQGIATELINYTKDGRPFWAGMKIEPILANNGELGGFMAIEADITSRYEERLAIEQATRRFNMATRAARVGVFERDANGEIVWWSDMMWEIFGQDPATFKPSHESWLGLLHPDDRERIRAQVQAAMQRLAAINYQYRIVRPDGAIRHIQTMGAAGDDHPEEVTRIGGVTLDVTDRVKAEEREQDLQQQLRESSHQAGMAEMATGVLHNVGNVLNSLGIANTTARRELKTLRLDKLMQVSTLLRDNRDRLADFLTNDERGRHLPDYMLALSDQIAVNSTALQRELDTTERLLNHLRDIISAQQQVARAGSWFESIRLNELLETALLVQAPELAQIEVVREYGELPQIRTDPHKLLQVVVNLIRNARDAVQACASDRRRIRVKLELDGNHARVTIEDSGIGMPEDVLSQLFRFGFTTKENGHGFGLHNSANVAREIGATLTAHSDGVGHGSRFILRLPIDRPESPRPV